MAAVSVRPRREVGKEHGLGYVDGRQSDLRPRSRISGQTGDAPRRNTSNRGLLGVSLTPILAQGEIQ